MIGKTFLTRSGAILLALTATAACSGDPSEHVAAANAALEQNKPQEARLHAMNAVRAAPGDDATRLTHARVMLALGDGAAALNSLEQVADSALPAGERRMMQAEALILQDKYGEAQALFAGEDPENLSPDELALLALAHAGDETLWEHRMLLAEGLSRNPEHPDLTALLGQLMLEQDDIDKAAEAARRGLAAAPKHYRVLLLNGKVAIAQGDLRGARRFYAKASELFPADPIAPANVIGLDLDLGEKQRAAILLAQELKEHPNVPFLQFQNARLAFAKGDLTTARNALIKVEKLLPDFAPAALLSGRVAMAEGRREFAISELGRALALSPDDGEARRLLAQLKS